MRSRGEPMPAQQKALLLARLRTVEGHVRGIMRMVEADGYCPDVLAQSQAVQRAIDRFNSELLERHLESCFVTAVNGASPEERERAIREVVTVFRASARLKGPARLRLSDRDGTHQPGTGVAGCEACTEVTDPVRRAAGNGKER